MKRLSPKTLKYGRRLLIAGFLPVLCISIWILWTMIGAYRALIYDQVARVPTRSVALVFGAGYWRNSGKPSAILQDRLDAAIDLYNAGRVRKLVFSGDNSVVDYNEPEKMLEYALSRGIPREAIVLDYAGRRTYDTCYRAGAIFQLQDAVLITQRYHLPRALLTCRGLGLDAVGYAADRQPYPRRYLIWYWIREAPALVRAWLDLHVIHPQPILGEPLPVFPTASPAP